MPQAAAPQAPIVRPGEYPNLNVAPQPAAAQLSADEAQAMTDELRARRDRQAAGAASAGTQSNATALRRLGDTHAANALKEIEGN